MASILRACMFAGHDVLVACPASFASEVADHGFAVAPFDDGPADQHGAVMARLPGVHPDEANRIVLREVFARIDTAAALPRLSSIVDDWRPQVIVRDPAEFASWLLAKEAGVPAVRVGIGLLSREPIWAEAAAEGLGYLAAGMSLECDAPGLVSGLVLAAAPAPFDPAPQDVGMTVHRYREALPAEDDDVSLPEGDDPLVYVTFGTVAASLGAWPGIYRAVVDGLAHVPVRVLVTTGVDVDPAELGPLPATVRVTQFVPQERVLRRTAAMVTHGGFGTVLGALRAGVPMAVAPLFADQFYNADGLAEVGAGIRLPTSFDPTAVPDGFDEAVHEAVRRLLQDPAPRTACRSLGDAMAAYPPLTSAVSRLEEAAGV
jgi:UDP:flavonoid glycosyltransferase YjiC (YdhE family)